MRIARTHSDRHSVRFSRKVVQIPAQVEASRRGLGQRSKLLLNPLGSLPIGFSTFQPRSLTVAARPRKLSLSLTVAASSKVSPRRSAPPCHTDSRFGAAEAVASWF